MDSKIVSFVFATLIDNLLFITSFTKICLSAVESDSSPSSDAGSSIYINYVIPITIQILKLNM